MGLQTKTQRTKASKHELRVARQAAATRPHHLGIAPHVSVERHVLDEAHVDGAVAREAHEGPQLVVVHAAHHHHVDLRPIVVYFLFDEKCRCQ